MEKVTFCVLRAGDGNSFPPALLKYVPVLQPQTSSTALETVKLTKQQPACVDQNISHDVYVRSFYACEYSVFFKVFF